MSTYFIGPHQFVELIRMPALPGQQVEVIQRPGVLGTALRRLGRRGEPFEVVSRVDTESIADGHTKFYEYSLLRGRSPVEVIWDDVHLLTHDTLFGVLSVQILRLKAISTAVGGLNSPSAAWLECLWSMVAVNEF